MAKSLIDKKCAGIGDLFLKSVRENSVLCEYPEILQGRHQLEMDQLSVNAMATRSLVGSPSYEYYLGTALALFDAAMSVAANPTFRPEIEFDSNSAEKTRPVTADSFVKYDYLQANSPSESQHFRPHLVIQNPNRIALGGFLFQLCAIIIGLHEQAHFFRGHLHLIFSRCGSLGFREIPSGGRREVEPRLARGMEFDADGMAVGAGFSDIWKFRDVHDPRKVATEAVQTTEDYVCLAFVGTALLFGLLSRCDRAKRDGDSTHPSPAARLLNIWMYFDFTWQRYSGRQGATLLQPEVQRAISDANTILRFLGEHELNRDQLEAVMQPSSRYTDDVIEEFREVRVASNEIARLVQPFCNDLLAEVSRVAKANKHNAHGT